MNPDNVLNSVTDVSTVLSRGEDNLDNSVSETGEKEGGMAKDGDLDKRSTSAVTRTQPRTVDVGNQGLISQLRALMDLKMTDMKGYMDSKLVSNITTLSTNTDSKLVAMGSLLDTKL